MSCACVCANSGKDLDVVTVYQVQPSFGVDPNQFRDIGWIDSAMFAP
jgi:hypothetical protein